MTKTADEGGGVIEWLFEWTSTLSQINWFWWLGLQVQTAFLEKYYIEYCNTNSQLILNKANNDFARNCRFVLHIACLPCFKCSLLAWCCARMANESRKCKRILTNGKMCLLKEVDMNFYLTQYSVLQIINFSIHLF